MNSIHESESVFQLNDFVYGSLASQCERRSGCAESRLDACIAAMAWWMLGWGFAYGDVPQYGFIGREQCAFCFLFSTLGRVILRIHFPLSFAQTLDGAAGGTSNPCGVGSRRHSGQAAGHRSQPLGAPRVGREMSRRSPRGCLQREFWTQVQALKAEQAF